MSGAVRIASDVVRLDDNQTAFTELTNSDNIFTTVNVDPINGSDSNSGESVALAVQTVPRALAILETYRLPPTTNFFIDINPTGPVAPFITQGFQARNPLIIRPTNNGPGPILMQGQSLINRMITVRNTLSPITIRNFHFIRDGGAATAIENDGGTFVTVENCIFGDSTISPTGFSAAIVANVPGSRIALAGTTTFNGSATRGILLGTGAGLIMSPRSTWSFQDSAEFTAAMIEARTQATTTPFGGFGTAGSFVGRRFTVTTSAVIDMPGNRNLTFLPGTIDGIENTEGVYT